MVCYFPLIFKQLLEIHFLIKNIYTWHGKTKGLSSRLDYWFISEQLLNPIDKCRVKPAFFTDHDQVTFTLNPLNGTATRGPGYWKFNIMFLQSTEHVSLITQTIKDELQNVEHYDDKGFAFDNLKMKIRAVSVTFAKNFHSERKELEGELFYRLDET